MCEIGRYKISTKHNQTNRAYFIVEIYRVYSISGWDSGKSIYGDGQRLHLVIEYSSLCYVLNVIHLSN